MGIDLIQGGNRGGGTITSSSPCLRILYVCAHVGHCQLTLAPILRISSQISLLFSPMPGAPTPNKGCHFTPLEGERGSRPGPPGCAIISRKSPATADTLLIEGCM